MNQIRTSALIGLGALGILFGRKMPGVQVIADEARIARYAAQPVVCNGEECRFSYVTPAQGKPVDLLLVAVKATVLDQAIADMKNFVGPDTVILSVLNGITSEEHIETAYPGRTLWSVAIGMDATRSGRTLVFNQAGKIQFGERDGAMTGRVQAVADLLDGTGLHYQTTAHIREEIWSKFRLNVCNNLPQAILGAGVGCYRDSAHMQAISGGLRRELEAIAAAKGIDLSLVDSAISYGSLVKPTARYSTLQDLDAHRHTEIEMFSGALIRMGQELGIPTPYNEYTYHMIKAMEEKNDGLFDYAGGEAATRAR